MWFIVFEIVLTVVSSVVYLSDMEDVLIGYVVLLVSKRHNRFWNRH